MKRILKAISAVLALLAVASAFSVMPGAAVTNDKIKAKQNEISALQELLSQKKNASAAARDRISEIKNEIEKTEGKVNTYSRKA